MFRRVFLVILLASGTAFAVTSLLVDPWSSDFGTSIDALSPYRDHGSRTAKAMIPSRLGCGTLFIGTSRSETGFSSKDLLAGRNAVNLGLSATNVAEIEFVLDYALSSCDPSLIVLEASLLAFGTARTTNHDFEQSPLNPDLEATEFWLSSVFSGRALHQSLDVLSRFAKAEASPIDSRGFNTKTVQTTSKEATRGVLTQFFTNPETYYHFELSFDRLAGFERMLNKIRARRIATVVFIPPVHAVQLEAIRIAGLWSSFERWKVLMASMGQRTNVDIYDFADYSPILAETISESEELPMRWFFESSHFRPALGEKVLARILTGQSDAELPGTRLSTASTSQHLATIRTRREHYALNNPSDVAWVEEIYREAMRMMEHQDQ